MHDWILSCCSTVDLTRTHLQQRDIAYVCFHYSLDDVDYLDDLGQSMTVAEFYQALQHGAQPRTWQVNVAEYTEHFRKLLSTGKDVLHLCFSSGLSGSYQSAVLAAQAVREEFPQQQLYLVDSLAASSGYGLFMDRLADLREQGMTAAEAADWALENRLQLHHWFFSTDLTYYVKGGRVSRAAGLVGGLLHICPLLNMDAEGHLTPRYKIRGKKKVMREIVECMRKHAQGGEAYSGKCYISHSACLQDAQAVAALVKESFPHLQGEVEIHDIGTTVGSHTGPGTVALYFWGDQRTARWVEELLTK